MPDRTPEFLPRLYQRTLADIPTESGFLFPDYAGYSILNIPDSICKLLGARSLCDRPLADDLLAPFLAGDEIQRVVLILVDALALHRLQRWMNNGTAPVWQRLLEQGTLFPLTSIAPSTTSAALTSLWTGRSPLEHAITGYEMWMKEYGMVVNTILHTPISFKDDVGSLSKTGFDPTSFLPFPTLGAHLAAQGIPTYALQHRSIMHSGLSRMFFKEVKAHAFISAADLWVNLRQLLETKRSERYFAYVYWSEIDTLGHRYGPDEERVMAEFASLSASFEHLLLDRLSKGARRGTLFLLTADHGMLFTPKEAVYQIKEHPALWHRLHIQPTGENRLVFLYLRPGHCKAIEQLVKTTWPDQFYLLEPLNAVKAGLFGPGDLHPRLLERIGDLIVAARNTAYWWWGNEDNHLLGRHGGLHPEEMLVPLLGARVG
jgi:hypothetical protein